MIDSSAKAVDNILDFCKAKKLPLLCTTGLSEKQLEKVTETAKKTAAPSLSQHLFRC